MPLLPAGAQLSATSESPFDEALPISTIIGWSVAANVVITAFLLVCVGFCCWRKGAASAVPYRQAFTHEHTSAAPLREEAGPSGSGAAVVGDTELLPVRDAVARA